MRKNKTAKYIIEIVMPKSFRRINIVYALGGYGIKVKSIKKVKTKDR